MYHIEMKNILCRQSEIGSSIGYNNTVSDLKKYSSIINMAAILRFKVAAIIKFGEHVYLINQIQCKTYL